MPYFEDLTPRPADALLGLMAAFRADPREDKIDLGVGVYRDDTGNTPIMAAVRAAEARLAETGETKAYEGPQGNQDFTAQIVKFVYGNRPATHTAFAAPGGCGALSLAMSLIKRTRPDATLYLSDPTWPNHKHIARTAGLQLGSYAYRMIEGGGIDLDAIAAALGDATPGDVVLFQGPCHNPTGIDPLTDQWDRLAEIVNGAGLLPLIDIAYHGFAVSLDEDMAGVRRFLKAVPDALVAYSCSKNFGLYRDRAGCFIGQAATEKAAEAVRTHVADIARASYSMPPAHGPAIVATILGDPELAQQWREELTAMRERMNGLRQQLADALHPRSNDYDPTALVRQNGMFSQLPLTTEEIGALKEAGVYIPGSGRINIAGLMPSKVARVAELISPYL